MGKSYNSKKRNAGRGRTFQKWQREEKAQSDGRGSTSKDFTHVSNYKKVPLNNHLELFQLVIGTHELRNKVRDQKSSARPYYVWARLLDSSGALKGVECINGGTAVKSHYYSANFYIQGAEMKTNTGSRRDCSLVMSSVIAFSNTAPKFKAHVAKGIDNAYLPDLILRRAHGLLFAKNLHYQKPFKNQDDIIREGIVFNTISHDELVPNMSAPEVHDSGFFQMPYTISGFLDQDNIDDICLISRHYSEYCLARKIPVIWPTPGTYESWPETFKIFVNQQDPKLELDLSWRPKITDFKADRPSLNADHHLG